MSALITDRYPFADDSLTMLEQDDVDEIRQLLLGHKVEKIANDHLRLDDGTMLRIIPNDGCGGCTAGEYELTELNEVDNVITAVDVAEHEVGDLEKWEPDRVYSVFIVAEDRRINLFAVSGNDGNGYYGTGYRILIRRP